ncbi:MAG: Translation initiation factor 2 [Candidatus Ozemobacter sibiricus]|uniref:Translation initiation factor 2 n=1 Tax=Candidatus Ozemobacter sibiricus TaxID=2268124 RepID=A0A367ZRF9_9BACT|nr:MAG: Translation initiation factor 2 [Candidatus Ozemobacter sibiricus]
MPPMPPHLPAAVLADLQPYFEAGEKVIGAISAGSGQIGRPGELWLVLTGTRLYFHTRETGKDPVIALLPRSDLASITYYQHSRGITLTFVPRSSPRSVSKISFPKTQRAAVETFCEPLASLITFEAEGRPGASSQAEPPGGPLSGTPLRPLAEDAPAPPRPSTGGGIPSSPAPPLSPEPSRAAAAGGQRSPGTPAPSGPTAAPGSPVTAAPDTMPAGRSSPAQAVPGLAERAFPAPSPAQPVEAPELPAPLRSAGASTASARPASAPVDRAREPPRVEWPAGGQRSEASPPGRSLAPGASAGTSTGAVPGAVGRPAPTATGSERRSPGETGTRASISSEKSPPGGSSTPAFGVAAPASASSGARPAATRGPGVAPTGVAAADVRLASEAGEGPGFRCTLLATAAALTVAFLWYRLFRALSGSR